jgi:hypothetical protein
VVTNLDDAHEQIDTAIATALRENKPVYLSISCNLPGLTHPTFSRDPVPFFLTPRYYPSLFIFESQDFSQLLCNHVRSWDISPNLSTTTLCHNC